ncbi:MAG: MarR family transcriptional regulator, partial [Streptomyces sp.]|nr:MarR family transcriptional regulator [Streptomyces sp.]
LTDSGRRLLGRAEAAVPAFLDGTFRALSPGEREQLSALLGKLLHPRA